MIHSLTERLSLILSSRSLPWFAALAALILTSTSLQSGWYLDDLNHRASYDRSRMPPSHPLDEIRLTGPMNMYRFVQGNTPAFQIYMDLGVFPWWTNPDLRLAFWRPLSAYTHVLDYSLWPQSAFLMHLHSLLWFAALAYVVALFYRQMMESRIAAGLAAVLYVINGVHALPVGFLANRHALIAALFGVLSIMAHRQWRLNNRIDWAIAAWLLFLISLLSAESGLAAFAYLFSYAIFSDPHSRRSRFVSLVPYLFIILIWRVIYNSFGYGAQGNWFYLDPIREPGVFFLESLVRLPFLLLDHLGPPSTIFLFFSNPAAQVYASIACVVLLLFVAAISPILRRNSRACFWILSAVLATIPACATIPHSRNLVMASIGAVGLLVELLQALWNGQKFPFRFQKAVGWAAVCIFLFFHTIFGSFLLLGAPLALKDSHVRMQEMIDLGWIDPSKVLILVNPPAAFPTFSIIPFRYEQGFLPMKYVRVLSAGLDPVELYRPDEKTLVVKSAHGYLVPFQTLDVSERHIGLEMVLRRFDALLWRTADHLPLGKTMEFPGMKVKVSAVTTDGRPAEATYSFDVPLEDTTLEWRAWNHAMKPTPFQIPAIGERLWIDNN